MTPSHQPARQASATENVPPAQMPASAGSDHTEQEDHAPAVRENKRNTGRYIGRFAPSPTGPLHMGSLVTALASWLDARAHDGLWLVRIEDLDRARCVPGASEDILRTLTAFGLHADAEPVWQSRRTTHYQQALERLIDQGHAYPCACTRKEIADSLRHLRERHQTLAYPGSCRPENGGLGGRPPRAWRVRVPDADTAAASTLAFDDRWQGRCAQDLAREVGDFVVRRADGEWAYQLAVVIDDALQDITDIVRGADLLDSTARQIWLQGLLEIRTPRYLHVPVVTNGDGEKLSKQTGAAPLDTAAPLKSLRQAGEHLGFDLEPESGSVATTAEWLAIAVKAWRARFSLS